MIRNYYYVGTSDDRVTVLQGIPGSFLGYSLQESALIGCIADDGTLRIVDPGSAPSDCHVLTVDDLRPSAREQVRAGLPSGTKDDATEQMRRLVASDLLPLCTPEPTPTPTPTPLPPAESPAPTTEAAPPAPEGAAPTTAAPRRRPRPSNRSPAELQDR